MKWLKIRARWLDCYAPIPSLLFLLPIGLLLAWDTLRLLDSGFWIDECGAYWLARHLGDVLSPPYDMSKTSALHALILSPFAYAEPPWMETVLRLPSLLATLGCAAILYQLAERLHGRGAGWLAALLYTLLPATLDHATEARPYAVAQFCFALALWALHTGRWAIHAAAMVALVYLHPFFALAWPLCALSVRSYSYLRTLSAAALLLVPLAYPLLFHTGSSLQTIRFLDPPSFRQLGIDLAQGRLGLLLIPLIFLAGRRLKPLWVASAVAWPLVLFVLARSTGSSFYIHRYLALSTVAFALLAANALSTLRPTFRYAAMLGALALYLSPGNPTRGPRAGDQKALAEWMQFGGGAGSPWLASSQFVEGSLPNPLPPDQQLAGWSFANLSTYPVMNPVYPMPWNFQSFARPALEKQLDGPWRNESRILAGPIRIPPPAWLIKVFAVRGYRHSPRGDIHEFQH
ncbi:MAG: glycosyltransferase family 39 protein [Bryobacteraceae bacterium]|nr:glycosyltransferase family 39 protein [Bryobacteraceae bacterium]